MGRTRKPSSNKKNAISISNLHKYFGDIRAIDGVSLDVPVGEIHGFLGPNGAGKSTTIRCMMDFISPTSGSIKLLGKGVEEYSAGLMGNIGYLPSEINLYEDWTGYEHIRFVKRARGIKTGEVKLIDMLSYDPSRRVGKLSTGNRQKLGLILALIHDPKLLILDEPTTGLDPILQQTFYSLIKDATKQGTTVFMSSHNLAEVEKVCDRVTIIKGGKIISTETMRALQKKRLYTVNLSYKGKGPKFETYNNDNIEIISVSNGDAVLQVKGNIAPLLKKLGLENLYDIEISHSGLEDMFMEHYKD